jgi:hypothetical protein
MKWTIPACLAATIVLGAADARADFGGSPPIPMSGSGMEERAGPYGPHAKDKYGLHPWLRKLAFWKKGGAGGCPECETPVGSYHDIPRAAYAPGGQFGPGGPGLGGPPGAALPGTPAQQMPGTLVFPTHPLVRSPRDFFMYEQGGR